MKGKITENHNFSPFSISFSFLFSFFLVSKTVAASNYSHPFEELKNLAAAIPPCYKNAEKIHAQSNFLEKLVKK